MEWGATSLSTDDMRKGVVIMSAVECLKYDDQVLVEFGITVVKGRQQGLNPISDLRLDRLRPVVFLRRGGDSVEMRRHAIYDLGSPLGRCAAWELLNKGVPETFDKSLYYVFAADDDLLGPLGNMVVVCLAYPKVPEYYKDGWFWTYSCLEDLGYGDDRVLTLDAS